MLALVLLLAAAPATPTPTPTPQRPGFISINATPWADLYVDGRRVGATPLMQVAVAPGRRMLRFVNPPLGIDETRAVDVAAGSTFTARVELKPQRERARSAATPAPTPPPTMKPVTPKQRRIDPILAPDVNPVVKARDAKRLRALTRALGADIATCGGDGATKVVVLVEWTIDREGVSKDAAISVPPPLDDASAAAPHADVPPLSEATRTCIRDVIVSQRRQERASDDAVVRVTYWVRI